MNDIVLPNFIFENRDKYKIIENKNIILAKSLIYKNEKMLLRNNMHLMILLIKGGKLLHLQKKDIKINSNDILFLSQGNYFMSEIEGHNYDFESIQVFFDDNYIFDFINKYHLKINNNIETKILNIKKDDYTNLCIDSINLYFTNNFNNQEKLINLKLDELFLYLFINKKFNFDTFLNDILSRKTSRVKYILESNMDIIFNIEDMCKLTRLNSKALRKEMNRVFNQNPKEWLDKNRLAKAVYLLKNSEKSISEISVEVGYSSVSWFIIQFKKYYKITPLKFREQYL
ncbi:helix-turn-helix domain-containing protein [Arcobacter sp. YIC-80]|uniref:AraC family transcriptional regulator n=1 Tax=Arcobacter sp. YIC-80 TaxID=3376683 RepID=UPI00384D3A34